MSYDPSNMTFYVGSADELNAAIANIDAIGKTGNNNGLAVGAYTIQFTQNITLSGTSGGSYAEVNADGSTGAALTINSGYPGVPTPYTVAGSSQLYAINLANDTAAKKNATLPTVTIDGAGYKLDGNGTENGFFVYDGTVKIENLTIADTIAQGGTSGNGGAGAGLGGGLFVAGTPNYNGYGPQDYGSELTTGGDVTLSNVSFSGDVAQGGSASLGDANGGGLEGGAGSGGQGGGGGIGLTATGGVPDYSAYTGTAGGPGIVLGVLSGGNGEGSGGTSGGLGGLNGGGGGGGNGGGGGSGASTVL